MAAESSLGAAGIMGGAQAFSGMLQAMYQAEMEKQKRIQEAEQTKMAAAGQYGQNQQDMLGRLLGTYQTALVGGR